MGIYTEKREQLIKKIKVLEKLRASVLSDEDLLELVGGRNADIGIPYDNDVEKSSFDNSDDDSGEADNYSGLLYR